MWKINFNWLPPAASCICSLWLLVAMGCAPTPPQQTSTPTTSDNALRLLSWNIAGDAFVKDPAAFRAVVRKSQADILLLDEVVSAATESQIRVALQGLTSASNYDWHISIGHSGGRQRGVIVSRVPLEPRPELSGVVPYPETERTRIRKLMDASNAWTPRVRMDDGIPVNGAVLSVGERRVLVVVLDLQCCGNDPNSWQEDRRRVETREIRRRIRQVLDANPIDAVIVAGDFNLVATSQPVEIISGPYKSLQGGLIAAELFQLDGKDKWTWTDRKQTRFPPGTLDYLLYTNDVLELRNGYVLDTEDMPSGELTALGLRATSSEDLSDHRPLVAEFTWR